MNALADGGSAVILRLNAEIYPLEAIQRAAAAFKGRGRLDVRAGSPHHLVSIDAPTMPALASEFANHVLATVVLGSPSPEPEP